MRFIEWMDCLLEQASEIFKKVLVRMFFQEEIFFCGKRLYFPTFSSHYSLLFKQCFVYFFVGDDGGGGRGSDPVCL